MNNEKKLGMLATIASALLFGITPVFIHYTYQMGSNANTITFYRNLLVVPILALVMLIKKISFRLTKRELGFLLLVGVGFRASTTFMLYESYNYTGIGTSTTLHFLYPVFTALICRVFFKEKLGKVKTAALLAASCGIAFFLDRTGNGLTGILLATATAVTYAAYMAGMDKSGLKNMHPAKVACYMGLFNALAMLLADLPVRKIHFSLSPEAMLYTLIIAVCTAFFAVSLLQTGIKYLGASTASILCMFEPITSVLAGFLFLEEQISVQKLIGCAVILGGVTIMMMVPSSPKNKKAPAAVKDRAS